MPDDTLDERMARLQRAAYGPDATDEERAAAGAELAALRSAELQGARLEAEGAGPIATRPRGMAEELAAPAVAEAAPDAGSSTDATPAGSRGRSVPARTTVVTALGVALVSGLAGFAAGSTRDAVAARSDDAVAVTASETEAWKVFDLPPRNGDRVRYPAPSLELELDRESRRMLASRWDGVRLVAVRTVDGRDGCLILISPAGPPTAACTAGGRFPAEGLVAETVDREGGAYRATWDATGRISLSPPLPSG